MSSALEKKKRQLGMNPSTAAHRLRMDILFSMSQQLGYTDCHQCGKPLTRDTFSIEHMEPWLDSDDPLDLYFDLNNISFSHLGCNSANARNGMKKYFDDESRSKAIKRNRLKHLESLSAEEKRIKRREHYLRTGN